MALRKPRPKKINPSVAVMSFSKAGTVDKYVEPMPDDQDDLEELVVRRFAAALHQRHGRQVDIIEHLSRGGKDPPDFSATEDGKNVGIEVTEVVDPLHRQLHSARQRYGNLVREVLVNRGLHLGGIAVRVVDSNGEPPYPPIRSKHEREIVACVVASIEQLQGAAAGLALGAKRHAKLSNSVCQWAVFQRVADNNTEPEPAPLQVEFTGGYMTSRNSLTTTIRSKVGKRYLLPPETELWLLTYGLVGPGDPESIETVAKELSITPHPFAEVWHASLIPSDRGGMLLQQIWRKRGSES